VSPLIISLMVFGFLFIGALFGMFIRPALPAAHLNEDTKDVIRLSMSLIATLAALVIGLLIASAKSSYDAKNTQIKLITANVILVDNFLEQLGSDARSARDLLRKTIDPMIDRIWSDSTSMKVAPFAESKEAQATYISVQKIPTSNESQSSTKARIIQIIADLSQARLALFTQADTSISTPFLAIVVFWLVIIFTSFSLFVRPNPIVIVTLFVCTLSASAAIFLILEMDRPFSGLMAISAEPLHHALAPLSPQ
jgi:Protein of unknown function (DUF4239)